MSLLGSQYDTAIKGFEGYAPRAGWDYKQHSVGWGTRAKHPGEEIGQDEAQKRYDDEMARAHGIVRAFAPDVDHGTAAALTSLTYNAGDDWTRSGLGAAIKAGDLDRARASFLQYTKAGGQHLPGLAKRRQAEVAWIGAGGAPESPALPKLELVNADGSNARPSGPHQPAATGSTARPAMAEQQREPTFLEELAGRTQNPLFQGGLGMFLAASQGRDLNGGLSAGTERAGAMQKQQMQAMEMRRQQVARQSIQALLDDPQKLQGLPPGMVEIARATGDPAALMHMMSRQPEMDLAKQKLALGVQSLQEQMAQRQQMYPLEKAQLEAQVAAAKEKAQSPESEFNRIIYEQINKGIRAGQGGPAIGQGGPAGGVIPQSFEDGGEPMQPTPAFAPGEQGQAAQPGNPMLIQTQAGAQPAQQQPQAQGGGITIPGMPRPLTMGETMAYAQSKDKGKFLQDFLQREDLSKEARNEIDKKEEKASDGLLKLRAVRSSFDPSFLRWGTQAQMQVLALQSKAGKLKPDDEEKLYKFATFRRDAAKNMNDAIADNSGLTVTDNELRRNKVVLPDAGTSWFDGDDPVTFQSKVDRAEETLALGIARTRYLRKNGFRGNVDAAASQVPIERMRDMINARAKQIEVQVRQSAPGMSQQMIDKQVDLMVKKEFGI